MTFPLAREVHLFPERKDVWGPLTRARLARAALVCAALLLSAAALGMAEPGALWLAPLAAVGAEGAAFVAAWRAGRRNLRRRRALNRYLATAKPAAAPAEAGELSLRDLQLMRFVLDRALQPVDEFRGFEHRGPRQPASPGDQIAVISYALSMAQFVHMPAFQGYLTRAQMNLADKQQEGRAGDMRRAGVIAAQLACVEAASGTPLASRFAPLAERLADGMRRSPFGLAADATGRIHLLGNIIGAAALRIHDRAADGARWEALEKRFLDGLENEFVTADGRFVPSRLAPLGLAPPFPAGALAQAFPCFFLNAIRPDIARRHWLAQRSALGESDMRGPAHRLACAAAAAGELGDEDTKALLLRALDEAFPPRIVQNVLYRPRASLWAHGAELLARCGEPGALRAMATHAPNDPRAAPHIASAPYPNVLIAKAITRDGALEAVLYPGGAADGFALELAGLRPSTVYLCDGACTDELVANESGRARLDVIAEGRTQIRVTPAR